jgi:hypothetical protein
LPNDVGLFTEGANGKKPANVRFVSATLNGEATHDNLELPGLTDGDLTPEEHAQRPLMFPGNHGPVAYRKVKVVPIE